MAALTGASRTTVANLFKKVYPSNVVSSQINEETLIHKRFMKRSVAVNEGEDFTYPLLTQDSDAGRWFNETDDLAQPRNVKNLKAVFNMKYYNRTVRSYARAIKSGGAFVGPLVQEIQRLPIVMARNMDMTYFASSTGVIADVSAVTNTTTFTVTYHRLLEIGMFVDVLIEASGVIGNGVEAAEITNIVPDSTNTGAVITIGTPCGGTIDTTYALVPSGSYNTFPFSIPDIVSASDPASGAYGGLLRATAANERWKSNEFNANGAEPTGAMWSEVIDRVAEQSGKEPTFILCHPAALRAVIKTVKPDARAKMSDMNYELFAKTATAKGVTVVVHRWCRRDEAWFLHEPSWRVCHPEMMPANGEWVRHGLDSGDHIQQVPNKWAYQAAWVCGRQVVCDQPRANARLYNMDVVEELTLS